MSTTQQSNWNEWSLKVLEQLTRLTRDYEDLKDKIQLHQIETNKRFESIETNILEKIADIEQLLNGGKDPEKGIIVRMDRQEQQEQRRTWLARTAIVSSIGAIFAVVAKWIAK